MPVLHFFTSSQPNAYERKNGKITQYNKANASIYKKCKKTITLRLYANPGAITRKHKMVLEKKTPWW